MAKVESASQGPSLTEVILGAVLSLVLGVVLAAVYLALQPVTTGKELPKEPVAGMVYYLEGSRDSGKARQAAAKQKTLLQGGSVELSEDELNSLLTSTATPVAPAPKSGAAAAPATTAITAETPNFRVRDGVLQIAVPVRVSVSLLGLDQKIIVQARGGFEKRGEQFVFVPSECYAGSCPLQRLPMVEGMLMKRFVAAAAVPEELAAAWRKLSDVSVQGATLRLTM